MCRQGSQTLTVFKGRKSRIDTLLKAQNQEMAPYFAATQAINVKLYTGVRACSAVLTDRMFFVLRIEVDTAI